MNLTNTASMLQSVNLCMAQERRVNKQQQKLSYGEGNGGLYEEQHSDAERAGDAGAIQ